MRFQLLMLDLDGTLADTLQDIAESANATLSDLGFPTHAADTYRHLVGRGPRTLFEQALPADRTTAEELDHAVALYVARYAACQGLHTRVYPGIPRLLSCATAAGLKLAVLSNKVHPETRSMAQQLFPDCDWARLQGLEPRFPAKPDPTSALDICRELAIAPSAVLYVGDSDVDMHLAHAAGFFACGAAWGFRGAEELRQAGANAVCAHPDEILPLLRMTV